MSSSVVAALRRAQNFTRAQVEALGDALSTQRWVAVDQLSERAEVRFIHYTVGGEGRHSTLLCFFSFFFGSPSRHHTR